MHDNVRPHILNGRVLHAHTKAIDIQLNAVMKTVSGTLKPTKTGLLFSGTLLRQPSVGMCYHPDTSAAFWLPKFHPSAFSLNICAAASSPENHHATVPSSLPEPIKAKPTCGGPAGRLPLLLINILYMIQPFLHPVSHSHVGNGQPSTGSVLDRAFAVVPSTDGG